jgi:hypothetical protein
MSKRIMMIALSPIRGSGMPKLIAIKALSPISGGLVCPNR